jgi:hypothetical protein
LKLPFAYIRAGLISFECLIVVCGLGLLAWAPASLGSLLKGIALGDTARAALVAIPLSCLIFVFNTYRNIMFPEQDKKNLLQEWSGYWQLRVHLNVATVYSVVFLLMVATSYVTWDKYLVPAFASLLTGMIGSSANCFSVFHAEIKINEMFIAGRRW